MKKTSLLALLYMICVAATSYGQNTENKDKDFLKNYKAPDFKQRRFDVLLFGDANYYSIDNSLYQVRQYAQQSRFGYAQYANTSKYQGNLYVGLNNKLFHENSWLAKSLDFNTGITSNSTNYFYRKPNRFFGVHHFAAAIYDLRTTNKIKDLEGFSLLLTPAVSVGFGRLEPVQYARNAMDIERSLTKGGRLKSPYSIAELTVLSDEIAKINNVRFYDFRLRRIDQFNALDKALQNLGHISDFDMTYFAYLADAYLYAQNFVRYSGFRHEFGLVESLDWSQSTSSGMTGFYSSAATMAFYHASLEIPASYTVQHSIELLVNSGMVNYSNNSGQSNDPVAFFGGRYTLGLYPTTRTNFNFGIQTAASLSYDFGYSTGLIATGYYYFSPQFRVGYNVTAGYGDNYDYNLLRGIWNENGSIVSGTYLTGNITLNYAIF